MLYAHPRPDRSEVNAPMFEAAQSLDGVTAVDLYADYPDLGIDVDTEQARLVAHDVIVFQHPLYWYSAPAIVKEWQDLVLEHGFAYGHDGDHLAGKWILNATTTGAKPEAYSKGGVNHADLRSLLIPFEKTADLCGMTYVAPFVLHGAGRAREENRVQMHVEAYRTLLTALVSDRVDLAKASRAIALEGDLTPFLLQSEIA